MRHVLPARPDALVAELSKSQLGLVTRAQALECGLSASAIQRRLKNGIWTQVLPGVYRLPGAVETWHQRTLAATMWAGPDAYASHTTAGALKGWLSREGAVEITSARRLSRRTGIVHHRRPPLPPHDLTAIDGIPATAPARTLLDLAGSVDLVTLESVLEEALRRRDVTITRLNWQLKTSGGKGVPGSKALGRLLADRPNDYRPLRSDLELRVLRAILRAGLPRPVHEHPVTLPNGIVIRPDFSYPDRTIAIECQSFRYHGGRQIWLRDVDRFNGLRRMGWTVIQVTPESLEREEAALMAELRQLLCR